MSTPERELEERLIEKLRALKYEYRADIRDRASLEKNFRQKFETLNRVQLTDSEFQRLLDELVTPDVFTAARVIRERNDFKILHDFIDRYPFNPALFPSPSASAAVPGSVSPT